MLKNVIGALLLLLSITACTKSPAESAKPAKSDYVGVVNDFADQISFEVEHDLSEKILSHEQMTGNQVRIVITQDLKGEPLSDYAIRKFNEWGVGMKGVDNGVLIAIDAGANNAERRSFIATGMEVEGERITDAQAGRICRNTIRPLWNGGQKGLALSAGLDSVIVQLGATPLERTKKVAPIRQDVSAPSDALGIGIVILFLVVVVVIAYGIYRKVSNSVGSDSSYRSTASSGSPRGGRARGRSSEDSGSSFSSYISDSGSSWSSDSGSSSSGDCGGGGCDGGGGGD
jgi:uncharacterized membrane protein YgcG